MPIIGATELQPVNVLGSYVQGLEMGRANQLAQQQAAKAQRQEIRAEEQYRMEVKDRETQRRRQELQDKRDGLALLGQIAGTAVDQSTYDQALATLQDLGVDTSNVPRAFNAKVVKGFRDRTLTEAQRLDAELRAETLEVQRGQLGVARREITLREREATANAGAKKDEDVVARTETAADGTVRMYNKYGTLLKTETGAGKPSATFEKTKATRAETVRNLDQAIFELTDAVKEGGLIDQSTGSGIGRGVDIAAGMFGKAMPGAVAIGKLQPIADLVLKMVPRFEGPQSDKDTQSYREAAGQLADPTLPNEIRKAAGNEILRLMKGRKGQFTMVGAETDSSNGNWRDL